MLEQLFGSRTRLKLLKLFLLDEGEYFVREITRLSGEKINSVRRELENLQELGIVEEHERTDEGSEKKKFYRANKNSVLHDELQNLLLKSRLLAEKTITKELIKLGNIRFLTLSGFFVGDEEALTDLLIVGQINKDKLKRIINKLSREFGHEIRYTSMSTQEFNYRNQVTDKFLFEVLEGKKIVVVDNK